MTRTINTTISHLGPCAFESPLFPDSAKERLRSYTPETERVRYRVEICADNEAGEGLSFEKAGPRAKLFFSPKDTTVGIVTCGGLSPGINNVIRSLVFELLRNYGVSRALGYRYGLTGFEPGSELPIELTPEGVRDVHKLGGSVLGSSRGPVRENQIVDRLVADRVNILFCIGGDGTQTAAHRVAEEIERRGLKIGVIGIPKTIDNDVSFVYTSFGFATAVEESSYVIQRASVEARSYKNSLGIVKLMGRNAGFIAAHATLAAQEVDCVLIPELRFELEGENGLLELVHQKIRSQGSAVVVVAEGAGQHFFENLPHSYDLSGNRHQHDIGTFLRSKFEAHFNKIKLNATLRYFDPGYSIRAVPANVADARYCDLLSRAAAHAGMAGKTDLLVGQWYNNLTHVPLSLSTSMRKHLNPDQEVWRQVLAVTGQPEHIGG